LPEHRGKVALAGKADGLRDVDQLVIGRSQQVLGEFDPALDQILVR
jgi:hypothetical protein